MKTSAQTSPSPDCASAPVDRAASSPLAAVRASPSQRLIGRIAAATAAALGAIESANAQSNVLQDAIGTPPALGFNTNFPSYFQGPNLSFSSGTSITNLGHHAGGPGGEWQIASTRGNGQYLQRIDALMTRQDWDSSVSTNSHFKAVLFVAPAQELLGNYASITNLSFTNLQTAFTNLANPNFPGYKGVYAVSDSAPNLGPSLIGGPIIDCSWNVHEKGIFLTNNVDYCIAMFTVVKGTNIPPTAPRPVKNSQPLMGAMANADGDARGSAPDIVLVSDNIANGVSEIRLSPGYIGADAQYSYRFTTTTNPPPPVSGGNMTIQRTPDSQTVISVTNITPGFAYTIEGNPDVANTNGWTPIKTVIPDDPSNGRANVGVTTSVPADSGHKFFRGKLEPDAWKQ